jgi:hypothetical protein
MSRVSLWASCSCSSRLDLNFAASRAENSCRRARRCRSSGLSAACSQAETRCGGGPPAHASYDGSHICRKHRGLDPMGACAKMPENRPQSLGMTWRVSRSACTQNRQKPRALRVDTRPPLTTLHRREIAEGQRPRLSPIAMNIGNPIWEPAPENGLPNTRWMQ